MIILGPANRRLAVLCTTNDMYSYIVAYDN